MSCIQLDTEVDGHLMLLHDIENIAKRILKSNPDPVVRYRLLRDILRRPSHDPAVAEALAVLESSRLVRRLAEEQQNELDLALRQATEGLEGVDFQLLDTTQSSKGHGTAVEDLKRTLSGRETTLNSLEA